MIEQTTFREMLARLGALRVVEPVVNLSYETTLHEDWVHQLSDSPHGIPWHVSFHASSFPGDSQQACGRLAMYGLMDIPRGGPADRWLTMTAESGKSIELQQVRRIRDAGYLAKSNLPGRSTDPDELDADGRPMPQIGFVDSEHWLTGSVDLPHIQLGSELLHIVEIKTKHEDVLDSMLSGERTWPDEKHRNQLLCSLGLAHENPNSFIHPRNNQILLPPNDGSIFYIARDTRWPRSAIKLPKTFEFYFEHSSLFMEQGRSHLAAWKRSFLDDELPQTVPHRNSRSHPLGWKWSEGICKQCALKKICRADYENGIVKISESRALEIAREVRPNYDGKEKRKIVLTTWGIEED